MSRVKLTGCCTKCDKEVYVIKRRYPQDSPLAGEPREVGQPINAVKYTLLLLDGSHMDLTFCPTCEPDDLPFVWKKVIASFAREMMDNYRKAIGLAPITQRKPYDDWFLHIIHNYPIGILCSREVNG